LFINLSESENSGQNKTISIQESTFKGDSIKEEQNTQEIIETPIGKKHQAVLPQFELNTCKGKKRSINSKWTPNQDIESLYKFIKELELLLGMKITNHEKAIEIWKKTDLNNPKSYQNFKKNITYYKNYFKPSGYQSVLRQKKLLL